MPALRSSRKLSPLRADGAVRWRHRPARPAHGAGHVRTPAGLLEALRRAVHGLGLGGPTTMAASVSWTWSAIAVGARLPGRARGLSRMDRRCGATRLRRRLGLCEVLAERHGAAVASVCVRDSPSPGAGHGGSPGYL